MRILLERTWVALKKLREAFWPILADMPSDRKTVPIADVEKWMDHFNHIAENINKIFTIIASLAGFSLFTLFTSDYRIATNNLEVNIPFLQSQILFSSFIFIMPLVFILLSFYMHIQIHSLRQVDRTYILEDHQKKPFVFVLRHRISALASIIIFYLLIPVLQTIFFYKGNPFYNGSKMWFTAIFLLSWMLHLGALLFVESELRLSWRILFSTLIFFFFSLLLATFGNIFEIKRGLNMSIYSIQKDKDMLASMSNTNWDSMMFGHLTGISTNPESIPPNMVGARIRYSVINGDINSNTSGAPGDKKILNGTRFEKAYFETVRFENLNIENVNFSESYLHNVTFKNVCFLSGNKFDKAILHNITFKYDNETFLKKCQEIQEFYKPENVSNLMCNAEINNISSSDHKSSNHNFIIKNIKIIGAHNQKIPENDIFYFLQQDYCMNVNKIDRYTFFEATPNKDLDRKLTTYIYTSVYRYFPDANKLCSDISDNADYSICMDKSIKKININSNSISTASLIKSQINLKILKMGQNNSLIEEDHTPFDKYILFLP